MRDGQCPFCRKLEDRQHLFWSCDNLYKILDWTKKITNKVTGARSDFTYNTFFYGHPVPITNESIWNRLWYLYVCIKKAIWKRRCDFIFTKKKTDDDVFMLNVKNEFRLRILVDFKRWSRNKFKEIWVEGSSIVSVREDEILCHIP